MMMSKAQSCSLGAYKLIEFFKVFSNNELQVISNVERSEYFLH